MTSPFDPNRAAAELPPTLLPGDDMTPSRRAFLAWTGFGIASSTLAGCSRGPTREVVPYSTAPEGLVAGRPYWVATTCGGCAAACGVLAKCRDGRPIKLEGNPEHALSRGGLCAVGQATVLGLYDSQRLAEPRLDGVRTAWVDADRRVVSMLEDARTSGGKVRLLTGTQHGPSTRAAIARFLEANEGAEHVSYDALSVSALLDAHERTRGVRALPSFRFDLARTIVSFDADFLGTWISPVSFAADYAAGRRPDGDDPRMSRHIQLEGRMSLTGAAADRRIRTAPWEVVPTLVELCRSLEERNGQPTSLAAAGAARPHRDLGIQLAEELAGAHGPTLVVCGRNDPDAQVLTAYANELLGNYGRTISVARPSRARGGDDRSLLRLRSELESGTVEVLVISGVNPAYDLPRVLGDVLTKARNIVVHSDGQDETAVLAGVVLPEPHALESWGDSEPAAGRYSLSQPAVQALRSGRTLRKVLAAWTGDARADLDLVRDTWRHELQPRLAPGTDFEAFFDRALHDGYVEEPSRGPAEPAFLRDSVAGLGAGAATPAPGLGLVLHANVGLLDGRHAHNPWLQELPDPVTKLTWDNCASLSPERARALSVEDGDVVRITVDETSIELPVVVQRGQHDDVVAVALGYGRLGTDRFAGVGPDWLEGSPTVAEGGTVGVNSAPFIELRDGSLRYDGTGVALERTGRRARLAMTQDHHTLEVPAHVAPEGGEVRDAVRTVAFSDFLADPEHALPHPHHADAELWPDDHAPAGHHWGMAVDLSSCIGCSACAVSCQAENNVPVVGKDEVRRHREMHWLRIDRYFAGDEDEATAAYQPMFCQQCDNAPCESVCPVLATVHSSEGLNQQVYNRCVGTRYCANTCPYKVRRFNWFDYPREDSLQNHSLNPDVTVRTRGVMEKCTFCAQRIQDAKSEASRRGTPLADGDIQVACQQSCPTQAIVFGDLADPDSRVSRLATRQRAYGVLTEINVKPSVRYLARVRNVPGSEERHGH